MKRHTEIRYLNNDGSKWVYVDENYKRANRRAKFIDAQGNEQTRAIDYFEAVGNFAACVFRYNGETLRRDASEGDDEYINVKL